MGAKAVCPEVRRQAPLKPSACARRCSVASFMDARGLWAVAAAVGTSQAVPGRSLEEANKLATAFLFEHLIERPNVVDGDGHFAFVREGGFERRHVATVHPISCAMFTSGMKSRSPDAITSTGRFWETFSL